MDILKLDGLELLLRWRQELIATIAALTLKAGGMHDGTIWHHRLDTHIGDNDAIIQYYNNTVGKMDGLALEADCEKMIQVRTASQQALHFFFVGKLIGTARVFTPASGKTLCSN